MREPIMSHRSFQRVYATQILKSSGEENSLMLVSGGGEYSGGPCIAYLILLIK